MITRSRKTNPAPADCSRKPAGHESFHLHPDPLRQCPPLSSNLPEPPQPRGRKRRRGLESDYDYNHPAKRSKDQDPTPELVPVVLVESAPSPAFTPLNKRDLDHLNRLSDMASSNNVGQATTPLRKGGKKRSLSRHSSTTEMEQEKLSSSSQPTSTMANYRWRNLDDARVVIEAADLPTNIERWVDAIIQPDISPSHESELSRIAETFCNDFNNVMKGAGREDDSLELIHTALSAMDKGEQFLFPRKAGTFSVRTVLHSKTHSSFSRLGPQPQTLRPTEDMAFQNPAQPRGFHRTFTARGRSYGRSIIHVTSKL